MFAALQPAEIIDTAATFAIVAVAVWWLWRSIRGTPSCHPGKQADTGPTAIPTSQLSLGRRRLS